MIGEPLPAAIGTAVVGAGQAGLAIGYHLRRLGVEHLILDEHPRVGDAWRERWDSLRLFTPRRYSGLPGWDFPGAPWSLPGKDDVADYLEDYAARFELPVRTDTAVSNLRRDDGRFVLTTDAGSLGADNAVVATGPFHHPCVPSFSGELDRGVFQLHSSDYHRPEQLPDGDVLVVGAGSSGAEIALELSRDHRVLLAGRDPGQEPLRSGSSLDRVGTRIKWLLATRVLDVGNPLGRRARDHFLHPPRGIPRGRVGRRDLRRAGVDRVPSVDGVVDGRPRLADGTVVEVAAVVWCTGFRADFGWIELPVFDEYGNPIHDRGVVPAAPGLYFLGLPFQRTLSSALIGGVGRDAEHVARHIAERDRVSAGIAQPATGGAAR